MKLLWSNPYPIDRWTKRLDELHVIHVEDSDEHEPETCPYCEPEEK